MSTLKVKDLIAVLSNYNPELDVYSVVNTHRGGAGVTVPISEVIIVVNQDTNRNFMAIVSPQDQLWREYKEDGNESI